MNLGKEVRYLSRADVEEINLSMTEIMDILEDAFIEKFNGRVEMPPKPGIHTRENAFIHAMPCWAPKYEAAGLKWVSGYPDNTPKGQPYIAGLIIMNDPDTGMAVCILDCSWITAKRTGAVTGMCAKYLANPDSESLGFFGCGVQARANLEALLVACKNIKRVYAWDHHIWNTELFVKTQSEKYGIECLVCQSPEEAAVDSDVLVSCGPIKHNPERAIEAAWIKPGAMLAPVDFDCMFKPGVIEETARRCFIDDTEQYKHFKSMGYFPYGPEAWPEVCAVVAGAAPGRTSREEVLAALNIGMALEDISVAARIVRAAEKRGLGTMLPL
jgi:ornithine cyclodeaminase/alanine dehydrogenase